MEKQVTDHSRPPSKILYISGIIGAGRRLVTHKVYEYHYPKVGRIFLIVKIEQSSRLHELYRKVLFTIRPNMTAPEIKTQVRGFDIASPKDKQRLIAQLLNSLLSANEAIILLDKGGILTDEGSLTTEINEVFSLLERKPFPPAIIISPRMIPIKFSRTEDDLSYLAVRSLKRSSTERLIFNLLKDQEITLNDETLNELIKLSDGHPFNIYRTVEEMIERGLEPLLSNPSDFIVWKHRQSSEYLTKVALSKEDILMLGLMKVIPELDFAVIVSAVDVDAGAASDALMRLTNLHIVESSGERFMVSAALRVAMERDHRIRVPAALQRTAFQSLAASLSVRLEEGTAPIALADAAVLSALESGENMPEFTAAFLLPSHQVGWLRDIMTNEIRWIAFDTRRKLLGVGGDFRRTLLSLLADLFAFQRLALVIQKPSRTGFRIWRQPRRVIGRKAI